MQIKKIAAVTLVELLVVLTVISTITALTLPALKRHSQKTEYAKLAQKGYNILEQAIDLSIAKTDNKPENWHVTGSTLVKDYLKQHLLIVKDCTASNTDECFKGYRSFKGAPQDVYNPATSSVLLADGIVISGAGGNTDSQAGLIIDVNGPSEPNMEGVDIFFFDFGRFDSNCTFSATGQWKLCPQNHAKNLMEDNWTITYW